MLNTRLFEGTEKKLVVYNRQAIIATGIRFYSVEECNSDEETDFDFPEYNGAYFRVYNERIGTLIKNLTMSRNGSYLVLNATGEAMTFEDNGNYYYEIGYLRGPYETALRYGTITVI